MLPALALGVVVLPMTPAVAETSGNTCVAGSAGWRAPVEQSYVITSSFGNRKDPITHHYQLHAGVDLAMLPSAGPVVAADAGTVVRTGPYGGLGNEVTLQHADGVQTLYGHMASIADGLKPGMQVAAGQLLGTEGSTGASTGPHLHFEVHQNGKPVNPVPFMVKHGAPLNGHAPQAVATGTALPKAGSPRRASLTQKALPVPNKLMDLYSAAAQKYGVAWELLAAAGMEETAHGRNNHTSSAGAMGVMQFMPGTFARYGVDGNGDGKVDIHNDADSVFSAANALRAWGATDGAAGIRKALFAYNHADWYVNDVLHYASVYAGGAVGVSSCNDAASAAGTAQAASAVTWAQSKVGKRFRFGADGPDAWDSSSFVQSAYKKAGVNIPRSAQQQRNWLATGHGTRIKPGHERPGDLIFEDSYLGPDQIGFVMMVTDPQAQRGVAARNPRLNVTFANYAGAVHSKHIFEVWRVNAPTASKG